MFIWLTIAYSLLDSYESCRAWKEETAHSGKEMSCSWLLDSPQWTIAHKYHLQSNLHVANWFSCQTYCINKWKEILYCSWEGAEVIEKHSSVWKTLSTKRVSKLLNFLFIKLTANLKKLKPFIRYLKVKEWHHYQ